LTSRCWSFDVEVLALERVVPLDLADLGQQRPC